MKPNHDNIVMMTTDGVNFSSMPNPEISLIGTPDYFGVEFVERENNGHRLKGRCRLEMLLTLGLYANRIFNELNLEPSIQSKNGIMDFPVRIGRFILMSVDRPTAIKVSACETVYTIPEGRIICVYIRVKENQSYFRKVYVGRYLNQARADQASKQLKYLIGIY